MPHCVWVTLALGLIVGLFGFLLRVGTAEPRERWDNKIDSYDPEHHPGDGGDHH